MMYSEFLEIAKLTEDDVTYKTYKNIIEPMYMAQDSLSKRDFVSILNFKNIIKIFPNAKSISEKIVKLVNETKELLGHTSIIEETGLLIDLATEYCEVTGYKFSNLCAEIYEYPKTQRGDRMFTGFTAKRGGEFVEFVVKNNKLIEI